MKALRQILWKCISILSICALLAPSVAIAKPLSADQARDKIVRRGVGTWVCVEESNGLLLIGRIASIDQDEFGMQLENYPDVTPVYYRDVTRLRFQLSGKGIAVLIGASVAVGVIAAVIMHHEFEAHQPQLPSQPVTPTFP
jgi:hypothetical protein